MTLHAVPATAPTVAFDVVDVLGRFASLARRSPTLDGGVPIRVAQGCVPLLEGNAWGFQLSLSKRLSFRKRLAGWHCEGAAELDRMTRAAVPMLLREGVLRPGTAAKRLERGALDGRSLFTGLFVRPRAGYRLRLSSLANRRSWLYTIDEAFVTGSDAFAPLFLEIRPNADAFTLDGEVATLGALPAAATFERSTITDSPDVARAHVAFYDEKYFATKKRGEVARKYRDDIVRPARKDGDAPVPAVPHVTVVDGGPSLVDIGRDRLTIKNAVSLTATFDGYSLIVEPDRTELDAFAAGVRETWQAWQRSTSTDFHEGALLYLTKYLTPHPPGEPHFFVKPPSLFVSSPGTSLLIDGHHGGAYDVMRGVVRSDAFHAAPAVFHLWRPGETVRIPRGAPLADLFVYPRTLDDATFDIATAGPGGTW